jgi:hypothetical protein
MIQRNILGLNIGRKNFMFRNHFGFVNREVFGETGRRFTKLKRNFEFFGILLKIKFISKKGILISLF